MATDIYLYQGEATPNNIKLRNPLVADNTLAADATLSLSATAALQATSRFAADGTLTWNATAALRATSRFAADATLSFSVDPPRLLGGNDVTVTINGVDRSAFVSRYESEIQDVASETPNTCSIMVRGFTPTLGQRVTVTQGPLTIFDGEVTDLAQVQRRYGTRLRYRLDCTDWTFLADRRLVVKQWAATSVSTIVSDIVSSFISGFTTANVQGSLTAIDFAASAERVGQVLSRLANAVGASWKWLYSKDLYFRTTSNLSNPSPLTTSNARFRALKYHRKIDQVRTRVYVQGAGTSVAAPVAVGGTTIPVADQSVFSASGGLAFLGTQIISYTGKSADARSGATAETASVTNGVQQSPGTPSAAVASTLSVSSMTRSGNTATVTTSSAHNYRTGMQVAISGANQVEYNGAHTITVTGSTTFTFAVAASATTPATGTIVVIVSGLVEAGAHLYKVSIVSADGESEVSSNASASPTQTAAPTMGSFGAAQTSGGSLSATGSWRYGLYFVTPEGTTEVFHHGSTWNMSSLGTAWSLTNLETSSDKRVTARVLCRTKDLNAGASANELFIVATLPDNTTTTYTDGTPETALTVIAPSTNTTGGAVLLTSIATGGTARRVWRTETGGSTYRYLTTIGDGSTVAYLDTAADASLGQEVEANAAGISGGGSWKTLAGATSLPVKDLAKFTESAGWVRVGSQVLRYGGRSGSSGPGTLTSIPSSGVGSIVADITVGQDVVCQPFLKGVPSSSTNSVLYALNVGDSINLWVQRDDAAAQAVIAALEGGDGIHEYVVSDSSLTSVSACNTRGDAELALGKAPEEDASYTTEDAATVANTDIAISISSISTTLKIQHVRIYWVPGRKAPQRDVTASSQYKTLYQYLADLQDRANAA